MKNPRIFLIDLRLEPFMSMDIGYKSLTDEEFKKVSKEQEQEYSLAGFQHAFNEEEIDTYNYALRILEDE